MRHHAPTLLGLLTAVLLLCSNCPALLAESTASDEASQVDFARDIAPIFSRNCVACHNSKKPEGGLNLESFSLLMQGGDSGEAVVAKAAGDSYLLDRVSDADDPMPPADNAVGAKRLSAEEIELVRRWIDVGAPPPSESAPTALAWQALPEHYEPIYAMDVSADGNYLAYGHGNSVLVRPAPASELKSPSLAHTLVDPSLVLADGTHLAATHLDIVQSLAISPDSQRIATGGYRTVKLWKRNTDARQVLAGLTAESRLATLSPGATRLAYAVSDSAIELVDIQSGQTHRFLKSHTAHVTALLWLSEDLLISCDSAGSVRLSRADEYRSLQPEFEGDPLAVKELHRCGDRVFGIDQQGAVFELLVSTVADQAAAPSIGYRVLALPNVATTMACRTGEQPQLLIAMESGSIAVVDANSGTVLHEFPGESPLKALSISSDGTTFASLPMSGPVQVRQTDKGEIVATLEKDYVHSQALRVSRRNATRQQAAIELLAAQIPELKKAAEAEVAARDKVRETRDKAAEALTAATTELTNAQSVITEANAELDAAQAAVAAAAKRAEELAASLEEKKKAAAAAEAKKMEAEAELAKRDQALATANDGAQRAAERVPELESKIEEEKARLAELQTTATQLESLANTPETLACVFSQDNRTVALASSDKTVRLYSAANGQPIANLNGAATPCTALQTDAANVLTALSSDGRVLAWDLSLPWTWERTIGSPEESPFSDRVTALDFSPDSKLLAVGGGPPSRFGEIHVVDAATGKIAHALGEVHSDTVLSLSFSPNGLQLASGAADKLCRVFDATTWSMLRAMEGHTHHVMSVAWHDNGQQLATAGADNSAKIWKVATGEQERTISGFKKEVTALSYVGQTDQLLVATADSQVRLYNANDGKQVKAFQGAQDALFTVAAADDSSHIYAGGQAGQIWTWQFSDAALVKEP